MSANPTIPGSWLYVQSTGELYRPDGSFCAQGYSGKDEGRNNPEMQGVKDIGPIPCGLYTIGEVSDEKGPFTIRLEPDACNEMFGRCGFLVHGDNSEHDASHGCIIMPRLARIELSRGGSIRVVATLEAQTACGIAREVGNCQICCRKPATAGRLTCDSCRKKANERMALKRGGSIKVVDKL